ncbi:MAG: AMP-binding protein [Burkholderiaceae bacterium]
MSNTRGTSIAFDTICRRIDRQLERGGDKLFAELDDGPLTCAALARDIGRLGAGFAALGLATASRAVVFSRHDRSTVTLFLALLRAGMTPVVGDPHATPDEIDALVWTCRPAIVFADAGIVSASKLRESFARLTVVEIGGADDSRAPRLEHLLAAPTANVAASEPPAPAAGPEVAMLVFTSGTTSMPKAVELTHANLVAQLEIFAEVYGFDADSRLLNLLPLHHVDGLIRGPLTALWFGASVHRTPAFSVAAVPALLESVAAQRITHFISVPAMLRIVERVGSAQPSALRTPDFRFVLSSADHLEASQWARFEDTFGVTVVNAYGLSEVVCDALFAGPAPATRRIGSLGIACGCRAVVVGDDGLEVPRGQPGELVIEGPTVMRGYFGAPELTAQVLQNGAFRTGDYFRVADDGLFEFVGRKKTAIVSAGVTLHPESVGSVLATMPGVAEAFAFGMPDSARGERLVAALAPTPGGTPITAADAAAFCRAHLAPERVPAGFVIVDALPRNAAGKVLVQQLEQAAATTAIALPPEAGAAASPADVFAIAARCFNCAVETLTADSTPFNTDGWDSLAHMAFIEELEAAFALRFSAVEITQILSLHDATGLVASARR